MLQKAMAGLHGGVQVLLGIAFVLSLWRTDWTSALSIAAIVAIVAAPRLLARWYEYHLPPTLDAALAVFVFATLFLGEMRNFYAEYVFWDSILHFQAGIIFTLFGFIFVHILNLRAGKGPLRITPLFACVFAFSFSNTLSVLWEVFEWLMDITRGSSMQFGGLPDTMIDLTLNVIGSGAVALLGYLWLWRTSRIPMTDKKVTG